MFETSHLLQKFRRDGFYGETEFLFNVPMKNHTSFKTGGEAAAMLTPKSAGEIIRAADFCLKNNIFFFLMGNGTNILVSDSGIDGLVIKTSGNGNGQLTGIYLNGNDEIVAGAGVLLSELSSFAQKNSFTGLEFASGIPGSVGGGIFMNAGAYDGEIKDCLLWADVITGGEIRRMPSEELELAYRSSVLGKTGGIVTGAAFSPQKGDPSHIKSETDRLNAMRKEKQPLNKPSAGSVFKRPEGYYAGKLIEDCSLSGYTVGGARVSPKHCGFIVNESGASSSDIYELIMFVQKTVRENFGVNLVPEIKMIGDFGS